MKNIAIIPARGGSKRLPGKNIRSLNGLPLIAHSILFAKRHDFIDNIYVTTDDIEIGKVAESFGAIVIERPENLSGDFEPTVSALKHVLENIEEETDNIILLQPTNPLRPDNLLTEAFDIFMQRNCDSLFTVTRNHQKLGRISADRFLPFNYEPGQRSQDLEPLFFENGLLYICKSNVIMQNKIITDDAFPFLVTHPFANVDIDTQEDFDYAAYLMTL